jgi:hypothetical protein
MKYRVFIGILIAEFILLIGLLFFSYTSVNVKTEEMEHLRQLCQNLKATDLAIWTEARYTRHPSQTDIFSAFQDCPSCLEHFPSGSILSPPPHFRRPLEVDN